MKYIFKAIAFIFFTAISQHLFSQGIANYNMYTQNTLAINPAYAGSQDGFFNVLHFRNQMISINNHPRSFSYYAHSPIGLNTGLGGNVTVRKGGVFQTTSANLATSYKVLFAKNHKVTFGLSGGVVKRSLDYVLLQNADLTDPTLQTSVFERLNYKFGFGALYNWKNFEMSLAMPSLMQEESNDLSHYFIGYTNYKYFTKDQQWKLQPSILVKAIPASRDQIDINFMAEWKKMLWAQAGYRSNNSVVYSAGISREGLGIGYAYEMPTGINYDLSTGTHEIVLTLLLKSKKTEIIQLENEIESRYAAFVAKRDSIIGNDSLSKKRQAAIMLDHKMQLEKLDDEITEEKKTLGELPNQLEKDSIVENFTDVIYDVKNSRHGKVRIQTGNYIIIQTVKNRAYAEKLIKQYADKGIKSRIGQNKTKGHYYLFTEGIKDHESARETLTRYKKKGLRHAWLLVR